MSRKKSVSSGSTDLQFISSLSLDEAVRLLRSLASRDTKLTLTEVNADLWQFAMHRLDPAAEPERVSVKGTLRRWQDSDTRFDCDSRLIRPRPSHSQFPNLPCGIMLLIFIITAVCLFITLKTLSIVSSLPVLLIVSTVAAVIVTLVAAVFFPLRTPVEAWQRARMRQEKQRDRLFADIHRGFKLAGDVSRNEDDLYPDDDPGLNNVLDRDPTGEYRTIRHRQ